MTKKIKLQAKIKAGENILAQHGEWWIVEDETDTQYKLRSEEMTLRYARMYVTYSRRTINKNDDQLFAISDEDIYMNPTSIEEPTKFPILEQLLRI